MGDKEHSGIRRTKVWEFQNSAAILPLVNYQRMNGKCFFFVFIHSHLYIITMQYDAKCSENCATTCEAM